MLKRFFDRFSPKTKQTAGRVLGLVFVVGLSALIFAVRDQTAILTTYGYPGIFLFSALTSATVILPAPGLLLVFSMGAVLNPWWIAVAAGVGATVGELSGYIAGISGRGVIEDTETYLKVRGWMEKHEQFSSLALFVLAFLPIPIFDMAGIAAGAMKLPLQKFFFWVMLGKVLKMLMVAFLGLASINVLEGG